MAEPLRRTLSKLRGKKNKRVATAPVAIAGESANGGTREGKAKALRQLEEQQQQQAVRVVGKTGVLEVGGLVPGNDLSVRRVRLEQRDGVTVRHVAFSDSLVQQQTEGLQQHPSWIEVQTSEKLHCGPAVPERCPGVLKVRSREMKSPAEAVTTISPYRNCAASNPLASGHWQDQGGSTRGHIFSDGDKFLFNAEHTVCNSSNLKNAAPLQNFNPVNEVNFVHGPDLTLHCKENLTNSNLPQLEFAFDTEIVPHFRQNGTNLFYFASQPFYQRCGSDTAPPKGDIGKQYVRHNGLTFVQEGINIRLQSPGEFKTCLSNIVSSETFIDPVQNSGAGMQQRYDSLDSEDDDYYDNCYDNQNLAFCEPQEMPSCHHRRYVDTGSQATPSLDCSRTRNNHGKRGVDSAQETDRLRTRLQEAYYLLIHAMHDMPVDCQGSSSGDLDRCPISHPSPDSICTQSSVRALENDAGSSENTSPQQDSNSDYVTLKHTGCSRLSKGKHCSKSSENVVPVVEKFQLHRSVSDSMLNYCTEKLGHYNGTLSISYESEVVGEKDSCIYGTVIQSCEHQKEPTVTDFFANCTNVAICSKRNGCNENQIYPSKPFGVTVNKMQDWMHRGRELSSEMKERIEGPTLKTCENASLLPLQVDKKDKMRKTASEVSVKSQGCKPAPFPAVQRVMLTDINENLQTGLPNKKELKVINFSEVTEQRLLVNNITVSKKRNWLQQSSLKSYPGEESSNGSFAVTGDVVNHLPNPDNNFHVVRKQLQAPFQSANHQGSSPTELPPRNADFRKGSPVSSGSTRNASPTNSSGTVDTSEENDADDEGEIWYNPIPEDDEAEVPRILRSCWTSPSKLDYLNKNCKRELSAGELTKLVGQTEDSASSSECVEDLQAIPTNDMSPAYSLHSTEPHQLHRQMFACKTQNGGAVEENPANKSSAIATPGIHLSNGIDPAAAFSPPSSPNPSKKVGSINWSLPEKIKSPRTVRKLSMKMKKLPELSRKLSVKGTASHNGTDNHSVLFKSKSHNGQDSSHGSLSPAGNAGAASRNVISRYHLDSSVISQHSCYKKKPTGGSKSASKGGYLSDGDSPELVAKSGKHSCEGKSVRGKDGPVGSNHKPHGTEIDIDAFRCYSFIDQPKCSHYISGLMSVHFYGAEDLKPPRMDSRDVFCAIQVDSVNKARTALLTCRTTFLDMDHTFNIELENAQHLKLVVFSWEPTPRKNRVCCHGTVVLPTLFRVIKMHQLAVKLEPRGLIYVKLTLMEQWENSLDSPDTDREPVMFGVEASKVVERENAGLMVPLLIEKCIKEIEKRGCQVVGLYRLCGSAAVKKELREAFERDSKAVELCESQYPDINVITGVLKDYLRELPSPLITKQLYEAVLDAMKKRPLKMTLNGCENDVSDSEYATHLLDCLPEVERATLRMLLDHLKLVASFHEVNKMTCQNLAVCFGPVLLSQRQEASNHSNRVFIDSEELASALDFKKHIEVLHYLLQLWPVHNTKESSQNNAALVQPTSLNCVRRKKRPQVLNLNNSDYTGVLRPRLARLDSPSSNRYARDWSSCGENYFLTPKESSGEADYDDVPSEESTESEEDYSKTNGANNSTECSKNVSKEHTYQAFMKLQEIDSSVDNRVNLKHLQESIDKLLGSLERELSKNKVNFSY